MRIKTGEVEENVLISQSISNVPEVQATFKGGFDAFIDYFKEASKDHVQNVRLSKLGS